MSNRSLFTPGELARASENIARTMEAVGIAPELIYAFKKTGRLVTEDNMHSLSADEMAEWNAAVEEYFAAHPSAKAR